jgi:hypothetical protein
MAREVAGGVVAGAGSIMRKEKGSTGPGELKA